MKILEGELYKVMNYLGGLQYIAKHEGILAYGVIDPLNGCIKFLIKLIKHAREEGIPWIFCGDDIYQYEDEDEWRLPSIELSFCLPDDKSCNDIPELWKKFNLDETDIIWDTEYSVLYPTFKTSEAAIKFTKNLDIFIDKLILKDE